MKKQPVRKLTLGKETLAQLDGASLGRAAGGFVLNSGSACSGCCPHMTSNSCNDSCKAC